MEFSSHSNPHFTDEGTGTEPANNLPKVMPGLGASTWPGWQGDWPWLSPWEGSLPLRLACLLTPLLGSGPNLESLVSHFRYSPGPNNKELWTEHGLEVKSTWIQFLSAKAEPCYFGQMSYFSEILSLFLFFFFPQSLSIEKGGGYSSYKAVVKIR